ncbi:MAG: CotH kinase family protein [Planctomycetota bacterium]
MHSIRFLFVLVVSMAVGASVWSQDVLITEFMASNETTLADEDQEYSDWIELYNRGAQPVDLEGWYLTDKDDELAKWRFPDVTIDPGEFLVVFASGNDRRDPNDELHTNFRLTSEGEYLALIRPDGFTVSFAYAPVYPFQFEDVSFGLRQGRNDQVWVAEGASCRSDVPTGTITSDWTQLGYNDNSWTAGTTGVGFDLGSDYDSLIGTDIESDLQGENSSALVRVPFNASDPQTFDSLTLRMKYDDGFVAYINGREVARRNSPATPRWNSRATAEHGQPETGNLTEDFSGGADYVLTQHGGAGAPTIETGGPTGSFLRLMPDDTGSLTNTVGFPKVFDQAASIVASFDFRMPTEASHGGCCGERADGFGFALLDTNVYEDSGEGPTAQNVVWERPRFPNAFSVGFDIFDGSGNENTVSVNWNGVEVASRLVSEFDLNNGEFNRCEVRIETTGNVSTVTVTLIPDVHGGGDPLVVIDSQQINGMPAFSNRAAFGGRTGGAHVALDLDNIDVTYSSAIGAEIQYEDIDITQHLDAVEDGGNVLAIHGMNRKTTGDDFLVLPELRASSFGNVLTGFFQYFTEATPGTVNSDGFNGFAEPPNFSRAGAGFGSSFDLTLSVDSPQTEIRYTLGGAEPTESSTLYDGSIRITSTTIVKAKAFEEGLLPSPTVEHHYVRLASDLRNFSSNLPIVILETFSQGIGSGSQTSVSSVFVDTDETGTARITDPANFSGRAGMKQRGSSSSGFAKKQWAFETWDRFGNDKNVRILGYPSESDYILYAPFSDKSLMRNYLVYNWSRGIGQWAVRTKFVEVFLNTNGGTMSYSENYHGVYVFLEKIKRDNNRVDIAKLLPTQNSAPEITGGYIFKKDRLDPGDSGFLTSRGQRMAYVEPKEREITNAQSNWLVGYMNQFESALYGGNFRDPVNGYARYIDVDSFIDHHIMTELFKNIDGYRLSTFYFLDRGGKLVMGPVWDFNLALGNANYLQGWLANGWYYPQISADQYPYFTRLFQDPDFEQKYIDRWEELRADEFATEVLLQDVNEAAAQIQSAQARNFVRWDILGTYVWPNWYIANTWSEEINWMKGWLGDRLDWIDSQWVRPPTLNQPGGLIEAGFELTASAPIGTVYYMLDGTDPRLSGGGVNPDAASFGEATNIVLVSSVLDQNVQVLVPTNGTRDATWRNLSYQIDGSWAVSSDGLGVGYENSSGYGPYIDVDTGDDMSGGGTSAYIRIPFNVSDPDQYASMVLGMRYDDGFVAYLNGTEIASGNAPASPAWNSTASTLHDDAAAVTFVNFNVSDHLDELRDGANVLCIHGLNENSGSSDFLIEPELKVTAPFDGGAVTLNQPTHVVARAYDGRSWSGITEGIFVFESDLPLRITEIMYHPQDLPVDSPYSGGQLEFVEIQNIGPVAVNLSGVQFTNGIRFNFSDGDVDQLGPGDYVVVVRNREAFEWFYGQGRNVAGEYSGNLDNAGDRIELFGGAGEAIHQFRFEDEWYLETDGGGYSLVIRDVNADPTAWDDIGNWAAGTILDGTPGSGDVAPPPSGLRLPGDANGDGLLDLSDPIRLLGQLFSGMELPCDGELDSEGNEFVLDVNTDSSVDISDASYLLAYLFLEGPRPARGDNCLRVDFCSSSCN